MAESSFKSNSGGEGGSNGQKLAIDLGPKPNRTAGLCPASGQTGRPVPGQTVKAMLKVSLRLVAPTDYFFCPDPTCPVVYFSADGGQTFEAEQLREAVYQKQPDQPEVLICYCFQYTLGALRTSSHGQRLAMVADIKQGTATGQCACDIRNPQGACCLANVNRLIKQLEAGRQA